MHIGNPDWSSEYWSHFDQIAPKTFGIPSWQNPLFLSFQGRVWDDLVAQAFAIKLYLDEQTKYTMSERHETASDPTGEFLFGPHAQVHRLLCAYISCGCIFMEGTGDTSRVGVGYATPAEQQRGIGDFGSCK